MSSECSSPAPRPAEPDHGFPRAARLTNRGHFDEVFQHGRKLVNKSLVVWIHPSPDGIERPRLGVAVGKRLGGAPARNRIKRLLREAFRALAGGIEQPVDMVIVPRAADPPRSAAGTTAALAQILTSYAAKVARGDPVPPARPAKRRR